MAKKFNGQEARVKLLGAFNMQLLPSSDERHGRAVVAHMIAGKSNEEIGHLTSLDKSESIFNSGKAKEELAKPVREFLNQLTDEDSANIVNSLISRRKDIYSKTAWDIHPITKLKTGLHEEEAMALTAVLLQQGKMELEDFDPRTFAVTQWVAQLEKAMEPSAPTGGWIGQVSLDKSGNIGKAR